MRSCLRSERFQRFLAGTSVSLVGLALSAIPLYDIWDDVIRLDWSLWATVAENSLLILLALVVVGGGIWLSAHEWDVAHVLTVARWTLFGAFTTAAVFAVVLGIQFWAIHNPKPVVIALDGVLIGTVGAFGIGIYNARTNIRTEQLATERDRFAGLFENTTDAIAVVALTTDDPVVSEVNDAFEDTFGHDIDTILSDALDTDGDLTRHELLERAREGEYFQTDFRHETDDGTRNYLLQLVPYEADTDTTYTYFIVTDITDELRLSRQRDANQRMQFLHQTATELAAVEDYTDAYSLVMDALSEMVHAQAMALVLDGTTVAKRESAGADGTADERQAFTAAVGERGRIEVAGDLAEYERTAVDLLATYLDRTLTRLDREHSLEREREHLEFVNRTLRHNLLNDLQVIRSRLAFLESDADSFEEHYAILDDRVEDMAGFIAQMRTYMQQLLESDEHDLEPKNLRDTLQVEVENVRTAHEQATVTLDDVPDVIVEADELLGPLFENLLTNAIVHNDQDTPEVHVSGERVDGEVTIRVRDNGPGIPDSLKEDIFEKGEAHFDSPGTGFGLYLVQQAVDTYGGDIEVVDNEPRGTEFRVTLPVADSP